MDLLQREVDATRKLVKSGAVPEIEFLRLQRQMVDAKGEVAILEASIPKARAAVEEARAKVQFADSTMRSEAHEDLGKALGDLAIVEESLRSAQNRVVRTSVKAPVRGIVNVDAVLDNDAFSARLRALAPQLRNGGVPALWHELFAGLPSPSAVPGRPFLA